MKRVLLSYLKQTLLSNEICKAPLPSRICSDGLAQHIAAGQKRIVVPYHTFFVLQLLLGVTATLTCGQLALKQMCLAVLTVCEEWSFRSLQALKKLAAKKKAAAATKKSSSSAAAAAAAEAKKRAGKKGKAKDKSTFNQVQFLHMVVSILSCSLRITLLACVCGGRQHGRGPSGFACSEPCRYSCLH